MRPCNWHPLAGRGTRECRTVPSTQVHDTILILYVCPCMAFAGGCQETKESDREHGWGEGAGGEGSCMVRGGTIGRCATAQHNSAQCRCTRLQVCTVFRAVHTCSLSHLLLRLPPARRVHYPHRHQCSHWQNDRTALSPLSKPPPQAAEPSARVS